jgi:hypothetical protein
MRLGARGRSIVPWARRDKVRRAAAGARERGAGSIEYRSPMSNESSDEPLGFNLDIGKILRDATTPPRKPRSRTRTRTSTGGTGSDMDAAMRKAVRAELADVKRGLRDLAEEVVRLRRANEDLADKVARLTRPK